MRNIGFIINIDRCVRCHACEIACHQEHDGGAGTMPARCSVATVGPREAEGALRMDFVPFVCFHCDEPGCSGACPVQAITKTEDGLVTVDDERCTGCRTCVDACPYGVMVFDEESNRPVNCDLCTDRLEHGEAPACVKHCIGGAFEIAGPDRLGEILSSGIHAARMGKVWYVSARWKLHGQAQQKE